MKCYDFSTYENMNDHLFYSLEKDHYILRCICDINHDWTEDRVEEREAILVVVAKN